MPDHDAPPPGDQPTGAPLSRLDAFGNELIALIDRQIVEGGLDVAQLLGTIEWVKWKVTKRLMEIAEEDTNGA